MKKQSWYLRENFIYFLAIVSPVISYIVILVNRKKWKHVKYIEYLFFSTITLSIKILGFVSKKLELAVLLTIVVIIFIRKWSKK